MELEKFCRRNNVSPEIFILDVCRIPPEDDTAQLAYIPAQVVSEYLRTVFRLKDESKIDGVIFTSTRNSVGKCVVVFPCDDDETETCSFDDMLRLCDRVEKKLVGV